MRKILPKGEKEKQETRNKIILGLILVGIMIISTAGYAFFSKEKENIKKLKYNNLEFAMQEDGLWHTKIQNNEFSFVYNPKDVENVSSFLTLNIQNYFNKPLFFSYESNRQGVEEIARNIESFLSRQPQFACLDECEEDFPVKNCSENIIIIKEMNETLIKQEENCVYILGKDEDVLKASDAFIFRILGVQ